MLGVRREDSAWVGIVDLNPTVCNKAEMTWQQYWFQMLETETFSSFRVGKAWYM